MIENFVIQSDISILPMVEERLFHFCHECNVGNYYSPVSVATMQAVENAIIHGNGNDISKKVDITFGTFRGGIFVQVFDEGAGFDFSSFGSLPIDGQMTGEGIFVMKSLADNIQFSEGGKKVKMEFVVSGIDPSDALERITILQERFAMVEI